MSKSSRHRGRLGNLVVVLSEAEHDQPLLRDLEPLEHPKRVQPCDPDQIGLVREREPFHHLRPLGWAALDPLDSHRDRVGPARAQRKRLRVAVESLSHLRRVVETAHNACLQLPVGLQRRLVPKNGDGGRRSPSPSPLTVFPETAGKCNKVSAGGSQRSILRPIRGLIPLAKCDGGAAEATGTGALIAPVLDELVSGAASGATS